MVGFMAHNLLYILRGILLKWNHNNPYGETIFEDWIAMVTSWDVIKIKPLTNPYFGLSLGLGVGVKKMPP